MLVHGDSPLPIHEVLVGTLSRATGGYGSKLTLDIPQVLQQPAPGAWATLLDFNLTVKGGTSKSPLLGVSGCPRGGLKVGGTFTFTDDTTQTVATSAACRS